MGPGKNIRNWFHLKGWMLTKINLKHLKSLGEASWSVNVACLSGEYKLTNAGVVTLAFEMQSNVFQDPQEKDTNDVSSLVNELQTSVLRWPSLCLLCFHTFRCTAYLIFVIFSPPIQFLAQFLSTQKRVNRDKTDYTKNSVNCHKTDFTTKNRINFRFLHICHV